MEYRLSHMAEGDNRLMFESLNLLLKDRFGGAE